MKTKAAVIWAGALALAFTLVASSASAGMGNLGNPGVLPLQSTPNNLTYDQWTAAWWQWVLSVPADVNPLFDETGANAGQGQAGPVWFLGGVANASGTAERTITVPAGRALFFPVLNFVWISTGPTDPQTAEGIRAIIAPAADAATDMVCVIDGVSVKNLPLYRTESPLFNVALPANNIFGIDPGTYGPSMDQGYYLMLAPLKAGTHTIHFNGSMPATIPPYWAPFSLDITYHITVAP